MAEQEMIAGLDIGSTEVRLAVGQRTQNPQEMIHIIGAAQVPAEGINRGVISSIEDAVSSISACLDKAERMIGSPVNSVWVGISGSHIISQQSQGTVAVARSDGEISEDDIERAIEAARTVATPPNYEILHVIPKSFVVDGQVGIKDPLGMTGVRLEVATQIIQGLSAQIKNLTKAVYRTGVEIDDLVLSVLANAEAVLTKRQKELGVALVNIGESTSAAAVFEEGDLLHTFIIPLGSNHITADIAIGLRTSLDVAESIKLEYGQAVSENVNKKEEINLGDFSESENESVSLKYISEIIEARVEEIFDMVDKELIKIDRSGLLPAGVVLTGGGAQLPGIIEVAKKRFRLPASLGLPLNINTAIDKVNNLSFTTAIGLAYWGAETIGGKSGKPFHLPSFKSVSELAAHAASWLKNLIRF